MFHRLAATVALFSFFQEAVPADGGGQQVAEVRFVQQAFGVAAQQVFLVFVPAAAAKSPRDIPAEEKRQDL